jgi:hypothetical protein
MDFSTPSLSIICKWVNPDIYKISIPEIWRMNIKLPNKKIQHAFEQQYLINRRPSG